MALELTSNTTNTVRATKKPTKTRRRRPVSGGVIIHFETWKRQRPTKGRAAEPKTLVVNAASGWVDSVVGAFDDNPIYERIMANAKEFRDSLDRQLTPE